MWIDKVMNTVTYPKILIPQFDENLLCQCGNKFDPDNENLKVASETMVVYYRTGERVYNTKVMYRPTEGMACRCQQHYDANEWMMWHCGMGKMVDYTVLHTFLHSWVTAYCQYKSIIHTSQSAGLECSLNYETLHKATGEFMRKLSFDFKVCYTCLKCGVGSPYFVVDAKKVSIRKEYAKHLSELDRHEDDTQVLSQGSKFVNYVFLASKKERDEVTKLASGVMDMEELIASEEITSENGKMLQEVVTRFNEENPLLLPKCYKNYW